MYDLGFWDLDFGIQILLVWAAAQTLGDSGDAPFKGLNSYWAFRQMRYLGVNFCYIYFLKDQLDYNLFDFALCVSLFPINTYLTNHYILSNCPTRHN